MIFPPPPRSTMPATYQLTDVESAREGTPQSEFKNFRIKVQKRFASAERGVADENINLSSLVEGGSDKRFASDPAENVALIG